MKQTDTKEERQVSSHTPGKVKAVKIQHYNGEKEQWDESKEILVDSNKIETVLIGNEHYPSHWLGQQRIVLKSDWEKGQSKQWQIGDYLNDNKERFLAVWPANIKDHERGNPICIITPKGTETEKDYSNAELIASAPTLKLENEKMKNLLKWLWDIMGEANDGGKIWCAMREQSGAKEFFQGIKQINQQL